MKIKKLNSGDSKFVICPKQMDNENIWWDFAPFVNLYRIFKVFFSDSAVKMKQFDLSVVKCVYQNHAVIVLKNKVCIRYHHNGAHIFCRKILCFFNFVKTQFTKFPYLLIFHYQKYHVNSKFLSEFYDKSVNKNNVLAIIKL